MTSFKEEVELGVENGPIRKFNVSFLLAPHSNQSAISNRLAQPRNVTEGRTDGRTDSFGIATARPRAARWRACIGRSKSV